MKVELTIIIIIIIIIIIKIIGIWIGLWTLVILTLKGLMGFGHY